MARYGFRNSTGGTITVGALSISAAATVYFYDDVEGTLSYVQDIQNSITGSGSGVCSLLSAGSLVYVLDGVDQTATAFFTFWGSFYGYVAVPQLNNATRVEAGKIVTAKQKDPAQLVFKVNNGSSAILLGTKVSTIIMPYSAEIFGWILSGDVSGSVQVDIYRGVNYVTPTTGSICGSSLPAISGAISASSNTLTGWSKTLAVGDVLVIDVKSVTNIKSLVLALKVNRT